MDVSAATDSDCENKSAQSQDLETWKMLFSRVDSIIVHNYHQKYVDGKLTADDAKGKLFALESADNPDDDAEDLDDWLDLFPDVAEELVQEYFDKFSAEQLSEDEAKRFLFAQQCKAENPDGDTAGVGCCCIFFIILSRSHASLHPYSFSGIVISSKTKLCRN
jgi:hypothetical protein